jgi:hypothetical protein
MTRILSMRIVPKCFGYLEYRYIEKAFLCMMHSKPWRAGVAQSVSVPDLKWVFLDTIPEVYDMKNMCCNGFARVSQITR